MVGRPNVGKTTLVNALVGQKIGIVSDKPQTTRFPVHGVLTGEGFQAVFVDTPGFHKPRTALGERLNLRVGDALAGVDIAMQVVDAAAGVGRGDAFVAEQRVRPHPGKKLCALNKIDLLRGEAVLPQLELASKLADFDHLVPVSARTGKGVGELRSVIPGALPEGDPLYPPDSFTDAPIERRMAEVVREKALALTREELPHSVAVLVEEVERGPERTRVWVSCTIFVERESQKGMVIGKQGRMLKEIGTRARTELEALLGSRVFLELRVKVQKDWQRDRRALDRLGL